MYYKYNKILFAKRVTLFMHRKNLFAYIRCCSPWPNKFDLSWDRRIWRLCGNEHGYSDWHIVLECKGHCFDFEAIRNLWNFYRNRQIKPRKNRKIKEKNFFFSKFFSFFFFSNFFKISWFLENFEISNAILIKSF